MGCMIYIHSYSLLTFIVLAAFTIDEVLDEIGFGWPQFRIGFMAGFAWVNQFEMINFVNYAGKTSNFATTGYSIQQLYIAFTV